MDDEDDEKMIKTEVEPSDLMCSDEDGEMGEEIDGDGDDGDDQDQENENEEIHDLSLWARLPE